MLICVMLSTSLYSVYYNFRQVILRLKGCDIVNTFYALVVKFLMTFVASLVAFSLFDVNPWSWPFVVALVGTVVNYLIGDLLVLPAFGNVVASVGDGIMAAILAWIVSFVIPAFTLNIVSLVIFAILIAIGEFFFHRYLESSKKVAP